jgi:intracellular multiplication protein IcmP
MAEQDKDSSNDIMYLLFAIAAIVVIIYYFFGHEIIKSYLTLKLWELKLINTVYPTSDHAYLINLIQTKAITTWKLKDVAFAGGYVGKMINIPIVLVLAFLSYKVWERNPLQRFKRILSMQTLKESEKNLWPYIAPVVNIDLINEPFDSGPYAMAMRPYDYSIKYKLLLDERNLASLDKVKAEKLFVSQLNKLWGGFNRLRKHEQALFAIMAAHGCGDKKGAMDAIGAIAQSAALNPKKMPDFSSVKPLLKYVDDVRVRAVVDKHAYIYTVLASMIEFARTTGVFPPSYIVWLRPRDRVLWYVLNCVGRQVAFVEVAGIFGHWRAEQIAEHKLESVYVLKAVDGLERALSEVKLAKQ